MVRTYLNEHPLVAAGFTLAAPVLILYVIWHGGGTRNSVTRSLNEAWYTDDDGKTWYADDKSLMPPVDHNGKTAVRAYVFSFDGGKDEFVGYLERYTPEARQALEQARAEVITEKIPPPALLYSQIQMSGIELKRPGESNWINVRDPEAAAIRKLNPPAGASVEEILP
jgi:hypothetical protein